MLDEFRVPNESKITIKSPIKNNFIKATYNLMTHNISLFGFEESTPANIWHEIMHKALWEDLDIPDKATFDWDEIAHDLQDFLELGKEPFNMNYKAILGMKK